MVFYKALAVKVALLALLSPIPPAIVQIGEISNKRQQPIEEDQPTKRKTKKYIETKEEDDLLFNIEAKLKLPYFDVK